MCEVFFYDSTIFVFLCPPGVEVGGGKHISFCEYFAGPDALPSQLRWFETSKLVSLPQQITMGGWHYNMRCMGPFAYIITLDQF